MKPVVNHPVAWLTACWMLVALVAARIDLAGRPDRLPVDDSAALLVNETRQFIGRELYRSSDVYFHRGARPQTQAPAREDGLTRLREAISPSQHAHLSEGEVSEILPWLLAAIRMDPYNIEAWRVAAFWLAAPDVGKYDQAIELLRQAERRHPEDYRPRLDLARFLLNEGDYHNAVKYLDRALARWRPDPPRDSLRQAELDKSELLTYRGLCHEIEGDLESALEMYNRILDILPNAPIAVRRDALRREEPPVLPPTAWVQETLRRRHEAMEACDHHDQRHQCDGGEKWH